jgi:hypothetical protein
MRTLEELKELISERVDEVDIVDLLGLTTQDIVEAFSDKIEERLAKILNYLDV